MGLTPAEVCRSWAGFRYGQWAMASLLSVWLTHVSEEGQWQVHSYAGYRVKAVDVTAFWRSTLKGLKSKHYDAEADKALPAVALGLIGKVGSVGEQRFAMLTDIVRADLQDSGEKRFITALLERVAKGLEQDEMAVLDAGFHLRQLFEAKIQRFVARLAKNFTARRNYVTPNQLGRPPEYGELVRPLARTYEDKQLAATPPDRVETGFYRDWNIERSIGTNWFCQSAKPTR